MSIRQSLLALLAEDESHGYQLRQEFELRTGGTWPLNIGQVYQTLNRLQRDGLVAETGRRADGSVVYRATDDGRRVVGEWWRTSVERSTPGRDEMAIKLAIAVTTPGVDVAAVIQVQRAETMRSLLDYTRQKREIPEPAKGSDLARTLVIDNLIYTAEAEARWLDQCEQRLAEGGNEP